MIDKFKSSLGLAAIIIGIGIAWVIIGSFIKQENSGKKIIFHSVNFELEISDKQKSEEFYSKLFDRKIQIGDNNYVNNTGIKLIQVELENIYKSKVVIKSKNYDQTVKFLKTNFNPVMTDSLTYLFDPDSNLLVFKPALQF